MRGQEQRLGKVEKWYKKLELNAGVSFEEVGRAYQRLKAIHAQDLKLEANASEQEIEQALQAVRDEIWRTNGYKLGKKTEKSISAIHQKEESFKKLTVAYGNLKIFYEWFGFFGLLPNASREGLRQARRKWMQTGHRDKQDADSKDTKGADEKATEANHIYDRLEEYFEAEYPTRRQQDDPEAVEREAAWQSFYQGYQSDRFALVPHDSFLSDIKAQHTQLSEFYRQLEEKVGVDFALLLRPSFLAPHTAAADRKQDGNDEVPDEKHMLPSADMAFLALKRASDRERLTLDRLVSFKKSQLDFKCFFKITEKEPCFTDYEPNFFFLMKTRRGWRIWYIDENLQKTEINIADILGLTDELNKIEPDNRSIRKCLINYTKRQLFDPFLQAPEVFGDDFAVSRKDFTAIQPVIPEAPTSLLRELGWYGVPTAPRFYINRYLFREKSYFIKNIVALTIGDRNDLNIHVFDLVRWLVAQDIVREHQAAIAKISKDAPAHLVSFCTYTGRWVFNPYVCEPFMSRMKSFETLLEGKPEEHCDFLTAGEIPTAANINWLHMRSNAAYVKVQGQRLFYVNKSKQECVEIPVSQSVLKRLGSRIKNPGLDKTHTLTLVELDFITKLTKHRHEVADPAHSESVWRYLQRFDENVVTPIYRKINQLRSSRITCQSQRKIVTLDGLVKKISTAMTEVLSAHFVSIADQALHADILTLPNPDSELEISQQLERIRKNYQARVDQLERDILIALHRRLIAILWDYADEDEVEVVNDLIETLQARFYQVLSREFSQFLAAEYQTAKKALDDQIQQKKGVIRDKAVAVQSEITALEANKKINPARDLIRPVMMTTAALSNEDLRKGGQRLLNHAVKTCGSSSFGWKALGVTLMVLGVVLFVGGILIATATAIPTLGLGALGGGLVAAGGVALFNSGAGMFYHGRQKGIAGVIDGVGESLCAQR